MKKITFYLNNESIENALSQIKKYKKDVQSKSKLFVKRLADIGLDTATVKFKNAIYDGINDVSLSVEKIENGYKIVANGNSVCFIEFGSGVIGEGHPDATDFGMGVSTWSLGENGKGHWNNPNGWYYSHGKKSFGNPPAMAMWQAEQDIKSNIKKIALEVFL